jgi:hypothetical protein
MKKVKNDYVEFVSSIFNNPLGICQLGVPQTYENMTIIPTIIQTHKSIDFITIKEAEEQNLIEIVESESVSQLKVINKSDKQILIPFGMTVHGGKQDRTIWEPILLPAKNGKTIMRSLSTMKQEYIIPAKCIEQSRWQYSKSKGFKASNMRIHPNVAFEAISPAGQGAVWNEIQSYRTEMKYASHIAPTQSYLDMTNNTQEEAEKIVNNFRNIKNQCGIAVFINNEFIGMEFYGNSDAWMSMSDDIFKAFSIEALRFKNAKYDQKESVDHHKIILELLCKLNLSYSSRDGVGLGKVVEFNSKDSKWRGITLVYDDSLVQFYLVSKRGGSGGQNAPRYNEQFQTVINQRFNQGYDI